MICPVSPDDDTLLCRNCDDDAGCANVGDAEIQVQPGEDKLVDTDVLHAEDDVVVQPGKCSPAPKSQSVKNIAIHNSNHLSYRSGCRHCLVAGRPNTQHQVPL